MTAGRRVLSGGRARTIDMLPCLTNSEDCVLVDVIAKKEEVGIIVVQCGTAS